MKVQQVIGAVFLACLFVVPVSQAAVITATFEAEVTSGIYAGTIGQGSFSYDDSFLVYGDETLGPAGTSFGDPGLVDFQFSIFGQSFSMGDDANSPDFPLISFWVFTPDYMEFLVDSAITPILEPAVLAIGISDWLIPGAGSNVDFTTTAYIDTVAVPEPAVWALFGIGLLGMGLGRKLKDPR